MADRHEVSLDHERFVAGDAVAANDFGQFLDGSDRAGNLKVATGDGKAHDDMDRQAEARHVEGGMVAGDDAGFLQTSNAFGYGGRGKAYFAAELGKGDAGVVLQALEDLPGDRIELDDARVGLMAHGNYFLNFEP